jgi:hypothetical protein
LNVGSFSKNIIKGVEKWNAKEGKEFPVALLSSNEKAFGKYHMILVAGKKLV